MSQLDGIPDSTTIALEMQAKHEAAYPHLVSNGMMPDRALLDMIDLRAVRVIDGRVVIPANFATELRTAKPHLFAEESAAFDARTASAAEVDEQLGKINRGFHARYAAALDARTLAELRSA